MKSLKRRKAFIDISPIIVIMIVILLVMLLIEVEMMKNHSKLMDKLDEISSKIESK